MPKNQVFGQAGGDRKYNKYGYCILHPDGTDVPSGHAPLNVYPPDVPSTQKPDIG